MWVLWVLGGLAFVGLAAIAWACCAVGKRADEASEIAARAMELDRRRSA